jgi:GMP synthase (glutamine-hydrolysing)
MPSQFLTSTTRKILIVKTGSSYPDLVARRGDFEDWFLAGMQVDPNQTKIVDVGNGRPLPAYDQVSGVVITSSHAMVTEHQAWSERTAEWLPGAIERGIPIPKLDGDKRPFFIRFQTVKHISESLSQRR